MVQKFFDGLLSKTVLRLIPNFVLPNHITLVRFFLIPPIVYLLLIDEHVWSFAIFLLASFTDAMDGAMARTRNQITDWGKLYDPLADKLLIGVVVAILVTKYISVLVSAVLIGIEIMLIVLAFYKNKFKNRAVQAVTIGKIKMVLQVVAVGLLFVFVLTGLPAVLIASTWILYAAIFCAAISLAVYGSI